MRTVKTPDYPTRFLRTDDFFLIPSAKLRKTEGAVEKWRNEIHRTKTENYGFASLAAVPYAHIVARMLSGKTAKGTIVTLAPNPKDIVRPFQLCV